MMSFAPIGNAEIIRLEAVAAEPIAKVTVRSTVSVLQIRICLQIYVCPAGTVTNVVVEVPSWVGAQIRASALSPDAILDSYFHY
jgi:hypothetical protein